MCEGEAALILEKRSDFAKNPEGAPANFKVFTAGRWKESIRNQRCDECLPIRLHAGQVFTGIQLNGEGLSHAWNRLTIMEESSINIPISGKGKKWHAIGHYPVKFCICVQINGTVPEVLFSSTLLLPVGIG